MATLNFFNQKPVLHIVQTLERTNNDVCKALAARIRLCNSDKNNYIGKGMFTNDFGRKKDGIGSITACGSKFCPSCVSQTSREHFKVTEYILDNLQHPKWLTLTLPDRALVRLTIDKQFEIFNYVYRELYRHSNLFQDKKNKPKKIDGTVKTIEFTQDENDEAKHVHYNLITDSPFLSSKEFLSKFNDAFKLACIHFGLKYQPVTNFFIKEIVEEVTDEKAQISKIDVNRKVARYLTKPQNWHTLKPAELVDMVESEKKYRMFATTGTCAKLAKQFRELKAKTRERRYKRMVADYKKLNGATIYLNKLIVPTSVSNPVPATAVPAAATPKQPRKPRKKSWRYRIKNKLITLADFKKELDETFLMMCEFRMKQLPEKYYWATDFRTLDGVPFETRLRYIEQDRKKQKRADNRFKRLGYEPVKNGSLFDKQPTTNKPVAALPVIAGGFIGNRKPQPAPVYNF